MQRLRWTRLKTVTLVALIGGVLTAFTTASMARLAHPPMAASQPNGRVLLYYDMEGASGIDDGQKFDSRQAAAFDIGRRSRECPSPG